jgi:hypothetical protein
MDLLKGKNKYSIYTNSKKKILLYNRLIEKIINDDLIKIKKLKNKKDPKMDNEIVKLKNFIDNKWFDMSKTNKKLYQDFNKLQTSLTMRKSFLDTKPNIPDEPKPEIFYPQ